MVHDSASVVQVRAPGEEVTVYPVSGGDPVVGFWKSLQEMSAPPLEATAVGADMSLGSADEGHAVDVVEAALFTPRLVVDFTVTL